MVAIAERAREAALRVADLLMPLDRTVSMEEEDPDCAAVWPAVEILNRTHREVSNAIVVQIAEARYREPEVTAVIECAREAALGVADLLVALDRAVAVHEQDPHGARVRAPVGVLNRAHDEVRDAIAVQIAESCQRSAKPVAIVKRAGEAALGVADLLVGFDGTVGVEEERPQRAAVDPCRAVRGCAHGEVSDAIAVQVAESGHGLAESAAVVQESSKTAGGAADLLLALDRAVGIHEEDPDRAAIGCAVVVSRRADGEVANAVAVEIAEACGRLSEGVAVVQYSREAALGIADLLVALDRAIGSLGGAGAVDGDVVGGLIAVAAGDAQEGAAPSGQGGVEGHLEGGGTARGHRRVGLLCDTEVHEGEAAHDHPHAAGQIEGAAAGVAQGEGVGHAGAGQRGAAEVGAIVRARRGVAVSDDQQRRPAGDLDVRCGHREGEGLGARGQGGAAGRGIVGEGDRDGGAAVGVGGRGVGEVAAGGVHRRQRGEQRVVVGGDIEGEGLGDLRVVVGDGGGPAADGLRAGVLGDGLVGALGERRHVVGRADREGEGLGARGQGGAAGRGIVGEGDRDGGAAVGVGGRGVGEVAAGGVHRRQRGEQRVVVGGDIEGEGLGDLRVVVGDGGGPAADGLRAGVLGDGLVGALGERRHVVLSGDRHVDRDRVGAAVRVFHLRHETVAAAPTRRRGVGDGGGGTGAADRRRTVRWVTGL